VERLLQFSGYLFVVLLVVTAVVMGLGSRMPVEHRATASASVTAQRDRVWRMMTDVQTQPEWRTGLKSVEMLPPQTEGPCWREVQAWMSMPLCVMGSDAPSRRVVRIADPALPFGGTWTYDLEADGPTMTKVTITEEGTTRPAMWRFFGHFVWGEDQQVKQYLRDLQEAAGGGQAPGAM